MPTKKRWTQALVELPAPCQDLLIGQLIPLGFTGFQQEEGWISGFVPVETWDASKRKRLRDVISRFELEFPEVKIRLHFKTVHEQNWNARWERSVGIVDATPRIVIKPSWAKLRGKDKGKIILHIDPKMSFGTGHHATTRLCLELLDRYVREGMRVLDFGTGTGVLAIAAAKLNAGNVVALDNDEWSIINAKENVKRNVVGSKVRLLAAGTLSPSLGSFDMIVANIDYPTISKFLPSLKKRLRNRGLLLLSGLLQTDLILLQTLLAASQLEPVELLAEDEWAAIALTKRHANRDD